MVATNYSAASLDVFPDDLTSSTVDYSTLGQLPDSSDTRIWSCRAENANRIYAIENLKKGDKGFTFNVFQVDESQVPKGYRLLAAMPIKVGAWGNELQFVVSDGTDLLRVYAFGRTPGFSVEITGRNEGIVTGRCWH